jgi:hypothetical protein
MNKADDMVGKRFGRLVIASNTGNKYEKKNVFLYECVCDCGSTTIVRGDALKSGNTASCGCLAKERRAEGKRKKILEERGGIGPIPALFFNRLKQDARERDLTCELTLAEFVDISTSDCYSCGQIDTKNQVQYRSNKKSVRYTWKANGLDRIDNSRGYDIYNILPCCKRCNQARNDMSIALFFDLVRRIALKNNLINIPTTTTLNPGGSTTRH